jgi:predicted ThiF/HesA family dinucleotide-utilizing enzyme
MGKLNDLAKKASGVSAITEGKTKLSTADVIKRFPNGFTISAVDVFGTGAEAYAVINIAEDANVYFFGGKALTEMVNNFVNMCGSVDEVNTQLALEPVKIKLTQTKTKTNRDFTSFEVI